jgi:hypothetical protein
MRTIAKDLNVSHTTVSREIKPINTLSLSNTIDQHFPALGSNCALKASTFINTLILSQHEGAQCLDLFKLVKLAI